MYIFSLFLSLYLSSHFVFFFFSYLFSLSSLIFSSFLFLPQRQPILPSWSRASGPSSVRHRYLSLSRSLLFSLPLFTLSYSPSISLDCSPFLSPSSPPPSLCFSFFLFLLTELPTFTLPLYLSPSFSLIDLNSLSLSLSPSLSPSHPFYLPLPLPLIPLSLFSFSPSLSFLLSHFAHSPSRPHAR